MRNAYYYKDIKFYFYFIIIWIHAENVEAIITRMAENFILMIPSVVDRHYVFLPLSFIFNYKFSHFALLNFFHYFVRVPVFFPAIKEKFAHTEKGKHIEDWLVGWFGCYFFMTLIFPV